MTDIQKRLFDLADEGYKQFQSALMPTVDPDAVIGVRTPALRKLAKELKNTDGAKEFILALPHRYYEENNLHAFLTEGERDFDKALCEVERFLPFVDNWATCDAMSPKAFSKEPEKLEKAVRRWLSSDHTYTVRYGIVTLMRHFLTDSFKCEHLCLVADAISDEYYVKMAAAWYFATALAFKYDETAQILIENRLDKWTHNKTIQKAIESYRITAEQKAHLKTLRCK